MKYLLAFWNWVSSLWGNGPKEKVLIALFILLVLFLGWAALKPAHAGELDVEVGAELIHGKSPYLGLYYRWGEGTEFETGAQMFGSYSTGEYARYSNWAWMGGVRVAKGPVFAGVGASYLQSIDRLNGSHPEFNLSLGVYTPWERVHYAILRHLSNAGTTPSNTGRNVGAFGIVVRRDQ